MRQTSRRGPNLHPGRSDTPGRSSARPRRTRLLAGSLLVGVLVIGAGIFFVLRPGGGPAVAWSMLATEDIHSLAFVGADSDRLLFGHHGGVLASADGGRSWQPLGTRSDAMSLDPAADGSIVIAGHDVFAESRDGGRTWQNIGASLPTLDIHGFARDPADPGRMWAYLATGGLWESRDAGRTWERVQQENILLPVAVAASSGTRLVGITAGGLATSDDGGRTWRTAASPKLYPIVSLAATADGSVLVAGGPGGLARSDDGGASWSTLSFDRQPFAIAVADGGRSIALVTRTTEYFRSDDGGSELARALTSAAGRPDHIGRRNSMPSPDSGTTSPSPVPRGCRPAGRPGRRSGPLAGSRHRSVRRRPHEADPDEEGGEGPQADELACKVGALERPPGGRARVQGRRPRTAPRQGRPRARGACR